MKNGLFCVCISFRDLHFLLTRLTFYLTFHCHTMISSWIRPLATTFMDAFAFSGYNQLLKKQKSFTRPWGNLLIPCHAIRTSKCWTYQRKNIFPWYAAWRYTTSKWNPSQGKLTMKPKSPRKSLSPKIQAQDESKEMRFRYICRNAPRLYCKGDRSWSVQGACYTRYASALKEGARSHWQTWLTENVILGRVNVRYCKAPTKLLYRSGFCFLISLHRKLLDANWCRSWDFCTFEDGP